MARIWTRNALFSLLLASIACWCAATWVYQATRPRFGEGTVQFAGQAPQTFTYPLQRKQAPKAWFVVRQVIGLGSWHPIVFAIYPEDALWGIEVNGHAIAAPGLPLSVVHHEGRSIDLGPYLHPGANEVQFDMEAYWGDAGLHLYASPWDRISLVLAVLVLCATALTGAFVASLFRVPIARGEAVLLLGGFLLRYLYAVGTPHFVRAYDWWGHEAYLDHVAQYLALPDPHAGWENFQPPLYYAIVGVVTHLLGVAGEERFVLWQGFSLACSTGVLIAGFWIARMLFSHDAKLRLWLIAILMVAPPLVCNASRVSNDVLLSPLEFIWLGLLLRFWNRPGWLAWLGLSFVGALALLTKANALTLIPISLTCLFLLPGMEVRWKLSVAMTLVVIVGAVAGWYYVLRAGCATAIDSFVVGNIHQLNPKGHIDGVFAKSLVFNPFKVLRYPFADPWGPRREYFLEYFFRSIFLGEPLGAAYRWIARAYVLTALLATPLVLRGLWISLQTRAGTDVPILVTFFFVFTAHWTFVQIAPYTSSQDFRFSALLLVPFACFYFRGATALPEKWKRAAFLALQLLMLDSAVYLLEAALEG